MANLEVVGLHYYPIKSCSGTDAEMVTVTPTGFEFDRQWMVVDENGLFQSQRKNPELALVYPQIVGSLMTIAAVGQESISLSALGEEGEAKDTVEAKVHSDPVSAMDEGPEAAEWFSEFLHKNVRLVKVIPELPRFVEDCYRLDGVSNRVGFADGFSITLATIASLEAFNSLLTTRVPMNRFRPNIVIDVVGDDLAVPYDEDYWRKIYVGEMLAYVVRACGRCEITDVNQVDASKGREVRSALTRNRRGIDITHPTQPKGMFFMQNLSHKFRPGITLHLGDQVVVEERAEEPNFTAINK